jgi:hypothetical protein
VSEEKPAVTILHIGDSNNLHVGDSNNSPIPKSEKLFWANEAVSQSLLIPATESPPVTIPSDTELEKTLVLVSNSGNDNPDGHGLVVRISMFPRRRLFLSLQSVRFLRYAPAVLLYYSEEYNEIMIKPCTKNTPGRYLIQVASNGGSGSARISCGTFLRGCHLDIGVESVRYLAWPGERGGPLESCLRVSLQQHNILA